jgi:heme/copper-type cytochrome/quinol oxidase subunit 2
MKKIKLHVILVSTSILSTILVLSIAFNWHGNSIQIAAIAQGKNGDNSSASTGKTQTLGSTSSSSNTIQLSVKEESEGVYRWISSNAGTVNPTLKVPANTNNIIKIQNPTDTKHELIIDTGAEVLPSSDDINPDSSGQLSFKPTMTGTFTYHCAYHPFTMKGTIQVVSGP